MPSLPELSDILADKRITEVFVKVEAEYTSKTYGYIGISGEVKVNLHSVGYYRVPRSDNGQRRKIAGLEERINDSAEVVCKDDLLPRPIQIRVIPSLTSAEVITLLSISFRLQHSGQWDLQRAVGTSKCT